MTGKIMDIQSQKSRFGEIFYYIFFKMEDGKSARTCVYPKFRNYQKWDSIITKFFSGDEIELQNLRFKNTEKRLVDADWI